MARPSLNTEQQIQIQALIRSWQTKLTWALLVDRVENQLNIKTTRQTLYEYEGIKTEYQKKKNALRGQPLETSNTELNRYLQSDINKAEKILKLEKELEISKEQIGLLQAFIRKISVLAEHNPAVMEVFRQAIQESERKGKNED